MNVTIPPEIPLWIGIGAVSLAMRPVFLALAILMLDWGRRGSNRLRVLQSSFSGKAYYGKSVDRAITNREKEGRSPQRGGRTEGARGKANRTVGRR
jgi:hypothetical protein